MPKFRPAGSLSKWFSHFGRRATTKRRAPDRLRSRRLFIEELEQRALLTTVYVDFGEFPFAEIALPEVSTGQTAGWDRLGLPLMPGEQQWIFGPLFPYPTNETIGYTRLDTVVTNKILNAGLPLNYFEIGQQPTIDPLQFEQGPPVNDPFEFEWGNDLPLNFDDPSNALELSVVQIMQRMFAPFNIDVLFFNAMDLQDARDQLSFNNRLEDPNLPDPEWMDGPGPDGPIGRNWNPAFGSTHTGDAYVLIGGWTHMQTGGQVGTETGIFGTSAPNLTNFITPELDPMMPMPDPIFGTTPLPYSDAGAAVCADTIIDEFLAGNIKNLNVAIATVAAQTAATTLGMFHSSDGIGTFENPFFDTDVELLTGSDLMREGPAINVDPNVPTITDVPFFSRFNMVAGDSNQPRSGTLTTRTDNNTGVLTVAAGHGITAGEIVDVQWTGGRRLGMTVTATTAATISIDLGAGDDLPPQFTAIEVTLLQNAYDRFVNDGDIGPRTVLIQTAPNTFTPFPIDYVTGTGAFDRIRITRINATTANVQVDAYRDSAGLLNLDPASLIGTTSYTVDYAALGGLAALPLLVEMGRNQDILEVDPALANIQLFAYGGHGIDRMIITGNGTLTATVTPQGLNPEGFNFDRRFDTQISINNGAFLNVMEFDNTSVIHAEGFANMTYNAPRFLGAQMLVDTFGANMLIDGKAPTLPAPPDAKLPPEIGVANLEFKSIANVVLSIPIGATNDIVTVRSGGTVATGLQSFLFNLGPDGGLGPVGGDQLRFDDSFSFAGINYTVGPSLVKHSTTPGSFAGFSYSGVENLTVTGTKSPNTFSATPSLTTLYTINGDDPQFGASPGDILDIDFTLVPIHNLTSTGQGSGVWTFGGGYKSIAFTSIENSLFSTSLAQQVLVLGGSGDAGQGAPLVKVLDINMHTVLSMFYAYETTFKGGVRIATADLNGDGAVEIITAPGPGRVGEVKIFKTDGTLLGSFTPEAASYKNGLYIAAGNVDGVGNFEILTSIGRGASKIRIFDVSNTFVATPRPGGILSLPFASSVIGGVVIASANVQGDGKWEVIAAPASGVAAQVRVFEWSGSTLIKKSQFNTFESTFKNGVSLAAGDIDGDGIAEIFVGAGARGNSRVRTYRVSGQSAVQARNQFNAFTTGNPNAALRLTAHFVQSVNRVVLFAAQANDGQTDEIRIFDLNPLTPVLIDKLIETGADFGGGINIG